MVFQRSQKSPQRVKRCYAMARHYKKHVILLHSYSHIFRPSLVVFNYSSTSMSVHIGPKETSQATQIDNSLYSSESLKNATSRVERCGKPPHNVLHEMLEIWARSFRRFQASASCLQLIPVFRSHLQSADPADICGFQSDPSCLRFCWGKRFPVVQCTVQGYTI